MVATAKETEMNHREVMQQALEALNIMLNGADGAVEHKLVGRHWWHHGRAKSRRAITALRAALEQPEQRCEYIRTSGSTHWCALGVKNESQ